MNVYLNNNSSGVNTLLLLVNNKFNPSNYYYDDDQCYILQHANEMIIKSNAETFSDPK